MRRDAAVTRCEGTEPPDSVAAHKDSIARDKICLTRQQLAGEMDSFGDDKIARLLRLKRYELPPPDYFGNFLREFRRRRQQDELVREPLWSICVDRGAEFCLPTQCPTVGLVLRRNGSTGWVRRHNFNHTLSAAGHPAVSSRAFARSNRATDYRKRIGPRASGVPCDFRYAADASPGKQKCSGASRDRVRSDEFVPLQLEWESVEDLPPPDR